MDQEEYLASLTSVLHISGSRNLDSGCSIHTCYHTQGGKGFTCDPAAQFSIDVNILWGGFFNLNKIVSSYGNIAVNLNFHLEFFGVSFLRKYSRHSSNLLLLLIQLAVRDTRSRPRVSRNHSLFFTFWCLHWNGVGAQK